MPQPLPLIRDSGQSLKLTQTFPLQVPPPPINKVMGPDDNTLPYLASPKATLHLDLPDTHVLDSSKNNNIYDIDIEILH